jgi:hypothetical protein
MKVFSLFSPRNTGKSAGSSRHRRPATRRLGTRLIVELLEDRLVPATVNWVGGVDFTWENAANWSTHALPGPADDVSINTPGITVTHTSSDPVSIHSLSSVADLALSNGNFAIASASTTAALDLSGGVLTGAGNLTVTGTFNWNGGTLGGSGATMTIGASAQAVLTVSLPGSMVLGSQTLNNYGSVQLGGGGPLTLSGGAVINNYGTFRTTPTPNAGRDINIVGSATGEAFYNYGDFVAVSDSTNGNHLDVPFTNAGTVEVQTGSGLGLDAGGTSSGSFTAAAGSYLRFSGATTLTATSQLVSAGAVVFGDRAGAFSGPVAVEGIYNVSSTGSTEVDNYDHAAVDFGGTVGGVGRTLNDYGDGANFHSTPLALQNLTVIGALQAGNIEVGRLYDPTAASQFAWSYYGPIGGPGTVLTIDANATAVLTTAPSSNTFLAGRTLNNYGSVQLGGGGPLTLSGGAVINNYGTFRTTPTPNAGRDINIVGSATGEAFYNYGDFVAVSDSTDSNHLGVPFTNAGTVEVQAGSGLGLDAGGTSSGSFTAAAGSYLRFLGATTLTATSQLVSAGAVVFGDRAGVFSGPVAVEGIYNVSSTGSTEVDNYDHAAVDFGGTVVGVGRTLNDYGDGANFHSTPLALQNLTVIGALQAGNIEVGRLYDPTAASQFAWSYYGPIGGPGTVLTIDANATAVLTTAPSSNTFLAGRTLNNYGSVQLGGGGPLQLSGGAVINNYGTFHTTPTPNAGRDIDIVGSATGEAFYNYGNFVAVSDSTDSNDLGVPFNNAGTVAVQSGGLHLDGGGISSGSFTAATGTFLRFLGNDTFTPSATVDAGTLYLGSALTLQLAGGASGTQWPHITAHDNVLLFGTLALSPSSSFAPHFGDTLTLVNNTSPNAIGGLGTFANLAEGAIITLPNGIPLRISYIGGDGNDVVLCVLDTPPAGLTLNQSASSLNEGSSLSLSGAFTDPDVGQTHTVLISWGDGSPNTTVNLVAGVLAFNGVNHAYLDNPAGQPNGSFPITVTVTDSLGASVIGSASVQVNNVAPTVGAITAPLAPVQLGTAISTSASFTDPGVLDTHTAVWSWGDNTTSVGTVTEANGSGSVAGSHTYAADGVYKVTLTVTDKDGGVGTAVLQYVVIYNPSAGFVTGGGWITSPAGAYLANPSLTGRANFGFNAKYQSGSTVPTGNTEFQFQPANLNFHATSYDWLVITTNQAQYQGSGTINGAGNYGFLVTVQDNGGSTSDLFRLKIWDKNNNNAVVYDTQPGAATTAAPTTALGGGRIQVHTNAQLVAGGENAGGENVAPLTPEELQPVVREAIAMWAAAGIDAAQVSALNHVAVGIADFRGPWLGMAFPGAIWIDQDAAGYGWYSGATAGGSSALPAAPGSPAYGKVDLLTVVEHELGHELGFNDTPTGGLMAVFLPTGTRRLPAILGSPDGSVDVRPTCNASVPNPSGLTLTALAASAAGSLDSQSPGGGDLVFGGGPAGLATPVAVSPSPALSAPDVATLPLAGIATPALPTTPTASTALQGGASVPLWGGIQDMAALRQAGGGNAVLVGGDGDSLQIGDTGRDLLIGGIGSISSETTTSTNHFAASTALDHHDAALAVLVNEWTAGDSSSTGVASGFGETGFLDAAAVFDMNS